MHAIYGFMSGERGPGQPWGTSRFPSSDDPAGWRRRGRFHGSREHSPGAFAVSGGSTLERGRRIHWIATITTTTISIPQATLRPSYEFYEFI